MQHGEFMNLNKKKLIAENIKPIVGIIAAITTFSVVYFKKQRRSKLDRFIDEVDYFLTKLKKSNFCKR